MSILSGVTLISAFTLTFIYLMIQLVYFNDERNKEKMDYKLVQINYHIYGKQTEPGLIKMRRTLVGLRIVRNILFLSFFISTLFA